jgi:hypothetical protein
VSESGPREGFKYGGRPCPSEIISAKPLSPTCQERTHMGPVKPSTP